MEMKDALAALDALAHPTRLAIFRLLVRRAPSRPAAGEIAAALGVPASTLSAQLAQLAQAGLIGSVREGRSIRYGVDLAAAGSLIDYLVADCCRGRPEVCLPAWRRAVRPAAERPLAVLFLCTANSARSLFAEAILGRLGGGRFRAFSAGSAPADGPHPAALALLAAKGHDAAALGPKPWTAFTGPEAPTLDVVFTLCDTAANEPCPLWPGQPFGAHWSIPDPAAVAGDAAARRGAFADAYAAIEARIRDFIALPFAELDALALQARLDAIGRAA